MDVKAGWLLVVLGFAGGTTFGIVLENKLLNGGRTSSPADSAVAHSNIGTGSQPANGMAESATTVVARKPITVPGTNVSTEKGLARIAINEPIHQFGDRESGEIVDHTFMIANVGQSILKISKILPACGCTVPKLAKNELAPGEQTALVVRLNLSRQKGPQNREIVVQSNDPTKPNVKVAMVGNAVSRVALSPERILLRDVPQESAPESVVKVVAKDGLRFNIVGTRTSGEAIEADFTVIKPSEEFDVTITLKSPLPPGDFKGWVHLLTDHSGEYRIVGIPVLADVRDEGIDVPIAHNTSKPLGDSQIPRIGERLEISGPTLAGEVIDVSSYRGEPVVVAFWASWCGVCKREIPNLKAIHDEFAPKGLKVVGVSLDRTRDALERYIRENDLSWPNIYFDPGPNGAKVNPLARKYNVRGVPRFLLLDTNGRVILPNARGQVLRNAVASALAEQESSDAPSPVSSEPEATSG